MVPAEELALLREKAAAFDAIVKNRFHEGFARMQTVITCMGGMADIHVFNPTIVTPFGKALMTWSENGKHLSMQPGDHFILDNEVKLSIS